MFGESLEGLERAMHLLELAERKALQVRPCPQLGGERH
jgi:hypothetical protein